MKRIQLSTLIFKGQELIIDNAEGLPAVGID